MFFLVLNRYIKKDTQRVSFFVGANLCVRPVLEKNPSVCFADATQLLRYPKYSAA